MKTLWKIRNPPLTAAICVVQLSQLLMCVYSAPPYPSASWSKPSSSSHACHMYVTCSYNTPNSRPPMLASLVYFLSPSATTNKSHTACTQTVSHSGPAETHQDNHPETTCHSKSPGLPYLTWIVNLRVEHHTQDKPSSKFRPTCNVVASADIKHAT